LRKVAQLREELTEVVLAVTCDSEGPFDDFSLWDPTPSEQSYRDDFPCFCNRQMLRDESTTSCCRIPSVWIAGRDIRWSVQYLLSDF